MYGTAQTQDCRSFTLWVVDDSIPIGQAVLQKVVAKLGGVYAASVRLAVPPSLITRFLDGTSPVPDDILLRAVDIVLEEFQQDHPAGASQPFDRTRK